MGRNPSLAFAGGCVLSGKILACKRKRSFNPFPLLKSVHSKIRNQPFLSVQLRHPKAMDHIGRLELNGGFLQGFPNA
jgi:hypothetical protein